MLFTTKWLMKLFTEFKGPDNMEIAIEEVITDSRVKTEKSLYIPIVGERFDGHDFVLQAIENGAKAVFWNKKKQLPDDFPNDVFLIFVEDTIDALQLLAKKYREEVNPIVIAITGSNGKTTTKDLVAAIIRSTYKTHFTQGNFNNHIGLPLTILSMARDTEVLVVEMGMNHFGEIEALSKIAKPDYGIITNIGESHIEFLGSREGIAKAKLEITEGMQEGAILVIDGDEPLLRNKETSMNTITCGYGANNDYNIARAHVSIEGTRFTLSNDMDFFIPLVGRHHAKNALFAILIGEKLGISLNMIKQSLQTLESTGMRFEILQGKNGVSIVNDTYNASPTSMKAAIEVVKQLDGFQQKVLVLGDILELGSLADQLHISVCDSIEEPITAVFTYGDKAKLISETQEKRNSNILCKHFDSKEDLLKQLSFYLDINTIILFKASRKLQFETFVEKIVG